jgi:hypothetical protein
MSAANRYERTYSDQCSSLSNSRTNKALQNHLKYNALNNIPTFPFTSIDITLIPLPVSSVYTHQEGYIQFKTLLHKNT